MTEYCDRHKLSVADRLALFVEVCRPVQYAHRKGILHRDLKPSNILIAREDDRPVPKIIDFGISGPLGRALAAQQPAEAAQLVGTPEYMSPEQPDLDASSDVYSLGVVLYELLCGALPFDEVRLRGCGQAELFRVLREEDPPALRDRLRQLGPGAESRARDRRTSVHGLEKQLSGDMELIVRTALAKDRSRRYQSPAALAADIERYLLDEPILVHPPGAWYRFGKLAKRGNGTTVALVFVAILTCGLALTTSLRSPPPRPELTLKPLTSYNGYEIDPALSPDGKRLAFSWNGDSNNYDIYVRSVDGGDPRRLTTDPAHDIHPAWSPDGRQIAFLRASPGRREVWIVPASGGPERKLADLSSGGENWEQEASIMSRSLGPVWSPDGENLAVSGRETNQGRDSICLLSLRSGALHVVTKLEPGALGDSEPAFSPDGRILAFVRALSQRGIMDIYTIAVSGGPVKRITFDNKTISGLAWWSDSRIVFTSNREGPNMLWSVAVAGGTPELIALAGRNLRAVSASNQMHRLVFEESIRVTNIWRVDLTRRNAAPERLISTTRRNDSPKYSPDGKRIVFGSDRSGSYEIWIADENGLHPRQLTAFGGRAVGTPRWSPDGRQIVFDGSRNGHSAIFIIGAEGGEPRVFLGDQFDEMMPSWSHDGRFIYFDSTRGGGAHIWKKPLDGGPAVQLTHNGGGDAVEAPDGSVVYFSDGRNGIWRVSPDGGGEGPFPGLEKVRHSRYFAATRNGIYFLRQDTPPWVIQFRDSATGRITDVARIEKRILYGTPDLTVSPDGHWLLYSQLDDSGTDVMMIESRKK